ncbi:g4900 [Coccomyxa elongata]
MAIAPEWDGTLRFGSCKEEASDDLQSKLLDLKLIGIEEKNVAFIKNIPIEPCWKNANKARRRWASYFDDPQKDCIAWEWGKIRV